MRAVRLTVLLLVVGLGLAGAIAFERDSSSSLEVEGIGPGGDPLAYSPARRAEFESLATDGYSHVVYANSPGGVFASARRTAHWRPMIERAATRSGIDPDLLEAIVFLESAGRPEVMAARTPDAAVGLAQIVPSTAIALLDMHVDLDRSVKLTKRIQKAIRHQQPDVARRLEARRARIDERFDPDAAIAAEGRYLAAAKRRFGTEDLAIESYHMGIGNLDRVIRTYLSPGDTKGPIGDLVAANRLTYAQLFFNSSPLRNPNTSSLLTAFGDESSTYYWKVLASREIMRLYRDDPAELRRLARLHAEKATAEEVFHPEDETETFGDPGDVQAAYRLGEIVPIPDSPDGAYTVSPSLGQYAPKLGEDPLLYRGLQPKALATLIYMTGLVRRIAGGRLVVTSAVRDREYQGYLTASNVEATDDYSLHTTGWSFDIARDYESRAQARAFQFVLDRLRATDVIDYAVEPDAIHVTVR